LSKMLKSLIVALATVGAFAAKCCTTCEAPLEKYLSVDTRHNKCGEACMNPKDFGKFHIFEKSLQKADSDSPCADRKFTAYDSTVTHGALGLKITLDLYNPSEALNESLTNAGYSCPDSPARIHASCKQAAHFSTDCATVSAEIQARVAAQSTGGWYDPHNNGTYTLSSATDTELQLQRITGDKKYTDKLTISLSGSNGECVLSGCSQSQVTSVADFSTNYCNVRMLYCGTADGCKFAKSDLKSDVLEVKGSIGAGKKMSDCLKL